MYCSSCGKQIVDDSRFCEFCGAAQVEGGNYQQPYQQWIPNPAKNNGKVWLIALSVAVVALLIAIVVILVTVDGSSTSGSETGSSTNGSETGSGGSEAVGGGRQNVSAPIEEIKIDFTAHEFYNKMVENQFIVTEFEGKIVTVSGTVAKVGRRLFTQVPYVDLYNGTPFNLCCEFSEDYIEHLSDLRQNQRIVIRGTVKNSTELLNCTIIRK